MLHLDFTVKIRETGDFVVEIINGPWHAMAKCDR